MAKIPADIDKGISLKFDGAKPLKAMLSYRDDEENKPAQKFYRLAFRRELLAQNFLRWTYGKILLFDEHFISGEGSD